MFETFGDSLKIWKAQRLDVYCGIMKKVIKRLYGKQHTGKQKTEKEAISINKMTFRNH